MLSSKDWQGCERSRERESRVFRYYGIRSRRGPRSAGGSSTPRSWDYDYDDDDYHDYHDVDDDDASRNR